MRQRAEQNGCSAGSAVSERMEAPQRGQMGAAMRGARTRSVSASAIRRTTESGSPEAEIVAMRVGWADSVFVNRVNSYDLFARLPSCD